MFDNIDMYIFQMILMMVLPLLLITVLPKMMNDPDTKREMEQMHQSMNVQNQVRINIYNWTSSGLMIYTSEYEPRLYR